VSKQAEIHNDPFHTQLHEEEKMIL